MSKSFREDLTGKRFGRLTVIEFVPNDKPSSYWLCKCDCENQTTVVGFKLKNGNTKSCGCYAKQLFKMRISADKMHSGAKIIHGKSRSRIYHIYHGIKQRCYNHSNPSYRLYGAKGIAMCQQWKNSFMDFYNWAIENGYTNELTIDRIDSNKNYCPENCRWVTLSENSKHVFDNPERRKINSKNILSGIVV